MKRTYRVIIQLQDRVTSVVVNGIGMIRIVAQCERSNRTYLVERI